MRVETTQDGAVVVVSLDGRLDAEWSGHLSLTLETLLRSGVRSVVVDMMKVSYASSAGATVITRSAQEFGAVRGELFVSAPPPVVRLALGVAGMEERVVLPPGERFDARVRYTQDWRVANSQDWRQPATAVSRGKYETSPREPGATLVCRVYGDPTSVAHGLTDPAGCQVVSFGEQLFGLGIGAIGDSYDDCGPRLGELVGAGGVVAYLPTDGALPIPDYLAMLGAHPPRALLASGLTCEGRFSHLVRFRSTLAGDPVPLSELAAVCLDAVDAEAAGIVMAVEVAGLVGASRRRAPAAPGADPAGAARPTLRDWLTFTAEPAHVGATALVAGVVARRADSPLAAHLRPVDAQGSLLGHLHAMVFSYQPVPQRTAAVQPLVASLLEHQQLRAVLHLLCDHRATGGVGESRLVRGLAWTAPVAAVT